LRVTPWLGLVALGCGTGEGASYVVLDEPARAALIEVEAGGRYHSGALPLEVEAGAPVTLLTPSGRRPLRAAPGMVYEVRGPAADVRAWRLTADVRTELVDVAGPDSVVRNLASALGARAPEPWNGRWRLAGPDALLRLSWMGDVPEVTKVALVLTDEARAGARAEWHEVRRLVPKTTAPGVEDPAQMVGFYTSDEGRTLFLDAEGGFVLQKDCEPFTVGRYTRRSGRVELDGMNLALTIDASGHLEAPGLVFFAGDEK